MVVKRGIISAVGRAMDKMSPRRLGAAVLSLRRVFGVRLVVMVVCLFFGLKGVLDFLSVEVLLPYLKELNFDGLQYQHTLVLALSPYAIKGLIGSVSDFRPLLGYHKKYYMLFTNVLAIACAAGLAFIPNAVASRSVIYVGLLYVGLHLHIATVDLLCEGVFWKLIRDNPDVKASFASSCHFCRSLGILVGTVVVGPITDNFGTLPLRCVFLVLVFQSLIPIAFNFVGEEPVKSQQACATECPRERGYVGVALLISACACGGLICILCGLLKGTLVFTGVVVIILVSGFWFWLPRSLALSGMFFFLDRVVHLTISGAVKYYYTAPPSCVPDGPNFDYTFFCTYTAIVCTLGVWTGIFTFRRWFQNWTPRNALLLMAFLRILGCVFDYMIVKRINIAIGIPDKVLFVLGDAILYHTIATVTHMTSYLVTLQTCPPNLEATVYAIISGVTHLGNTCSKMLGSVSIDVAGIRMKEDAPGGCDFSALPNLILISHGLLPLIGVPLAVLMLPKHPINATLADPEGDDESKGPCGEAVPAAAEAEPTEAPTETVSDAESDISHVVCVKEVPEESCGDSAAEPEGRPAAGAQPV